MNRASRALSVKSARADKPNEDFYIADDARGIYIVADGVTTTPRAGDPYPHPSGGELAARCFCETAHRRLADNPAQVTAQDLRAAVEAGNRAVGDLNRVRGRDVDVNYLDKDYIGAVATAGLIADGRVSVVHVGDTLTLLWRGAGCRLLTEIQTLGVAAYQQWVRAHRVRLAEHPTILVRRDFRNHREAQGLNGEAVGYGVYTGESGALDFLQEIQEPVYPGDSLWLATDGFASLVLPLAQDPQRAAAFAAAYERESRSLAWVADQADQKAGAADDKTLVEIRVQ